MLRSLLANANNQVMVVPVEKDRYGHTVGEIFVKTPTREQPEQELFINYEMVASGWAYHYERYSEKCDREMLAKAEQLAQSKHLGVWVGNYQRSWDYRRQQQ
ncbi:MAG: thermonuclease family protein [Tildeniella nuda ZEHNDER 1965/U140]|nr:thermonuclease family protein [Tildeniella nuda ZEHNDER 1965/U140]